MTDATTRSAAGVLPFPPAANRDSLTVGDLADLYMAAYKGRDNSRAHYLREWVARIGSLRLRDLDADSGVQIKVPDCARLRANGENEVAGLVPDVLVPWRGNDSPYQRAARALAALESWTEKLK